MLNLAGPVSGEFGEKADVTLGFVAALKQQGPVDSKSGLPACGFSLLV